MAGEDGAAQPNRYGIYRHPKYIHFHFEHYAAEEEKGEETRMAIGRSKGNEKW